MNGAQWARPLNSVQKRRNKALKLQCLKSIFKCNLNILDLFLTKIQSTFNKVKEVFEQILLCLAHGVARRRR
jgi:hypothetical protein